MIVAFQKIKQKSYMFDMYNLQTKMIQKQNYGYFLFIIIHMKSAYLIGNLGWFRAIQYHCGNFNVLTIIMQQCQKQIENRRGALNQQNVFYTRFQSDSYEM